MKKINKIVAVLCAAAMVVGSIAYTPAESEAAKAPKLNKKTISVKVGSKYKIKLKNGNKKAKVTWKINKKKVARITKKSTKGKKAFATVKGLKKGKAKLTATYKLGKKSKKLTCTVTVKEKGDSVTPVPTQKGSNITPQPVVTDPTPVPTPTPEPFTIIDNSKANAMMYIDANDSEYDGISIIAVRIYGSG